MGAKVNEDIRETKDEELKRPQGFFGVRHLQFLLMFFAVFISYGMRTNMSVAILAMIEDNPPDPSIPTYPDWTEKDTILSSFFWGYVIPQIGAGQLVKRFGPKWFLDATMFINSLFCLLIPVMAQNLGEAGVIVCRVLQGLAQGFLYPSCHNLLGKWAPLAERSAIASFVYTAGPLGTVVAMPVTGVISNAKIGWPLSFYLYGVLGICWCFVWSWLGCNHPSQHKNISIEERQYIEGSLHLDDNKPEMATPWKAILTSMPFWAILVAHCGQNWGFWTLLTEIPSYMENIMKYNIKDNSMLSALPYLVLWILSFIFSPIADYLIVRRYLSMSNVRKIFNTIGLVIPAFALIALGFIDSDQKTLAIVLLVIAVGFNAAIFSGFNVNHIDLSPNFSGTLMGITNSLSNIFSIVAPLVVKAIGIEQTDPILWRIVFCIASGVYIVTNCFYVIFASGEVQSWNSG